MRHLKMLLNLSVIVFSFALGVTAAPGSTFTKIDFPGALATFALGINDPGEVAGSYNDATGNAHGFLLVRGSFSTIDFPGALDTLARGINNPGAIVGFYRDTTGKFHGFLQE